MNIVTLVPKRFILNLCSCFKVDAEVYVSHEHDFYCFSWLYPLQWDPKADIYKLPSQKACCTHIHKGQLSIHGV